jgi:hypothetical protein
MSDGETGIVITRITRTGTLFAVAQIIAPRQPIKAPPIMKYLLPKISDNLPTIKNITPRTTLYTREIQTYRGSGPISAFMIPSTGAA